MHYQQLGQSELIVSRICFGCWQLSPRFWGEVEIKPWEAALEKAAELGVNFIDTAGAYGNGYAESCLGAFFEKSGLRDQFILATKFYWTFEKAERHPDTSYDFIIQSCEDALRRMKTDRIDLFQVHAWDPMTRPEEVAAAIAQLKRQGKVRYFGASNLEAEQIALYQSCIDVVSLQPWYNLLERTVEARELPYCQRHKIGVIPYSPLYRGLLTGKYARDHQFTDDRANLPLYQGRAFQRLLDATDALKPIAEGLGLSVAQLSIRWLLSHPAITSAIVGIKTADHIESIVPAAEASLDGPTWHKVAGIMATAKAEALAG